jgi:hypothetical protein
MSSVGKPNMFHVVPVEDLNAERDVFVGVPVETTNKQTFHRVPIRSSCTESIDEDRRLRVQMVPGSSCVVQSCQGLRRLLLKFPRVFVPGIRVFEANGDNDRTNLSMGFALYDYRTGPGPEEQRVLANLDGLAAFLRHTMMRCDKIRRTLKLGPDNMTVQQQQVAADMMDLYVVRPAVDRGDAGGSAGNFRARNGGGEDRVPSRYCYVKLVAPDPNVNEVYHTYFWTRDGKRIPFETVLAYRNFHVEPFVEIEDVFVSKAVRSLQMKLRECIVYPPAERMQQRFSVCFPERLCTKEEEDEQLVVAPGPAAAAAAAACTEECVLVAPSDAPEEPQAKRARVEIVDTGAETGSEAGTEPDVVAGPGGEDGDAQPL